MNYLKTFENYQHPTFYELVDELNKEFLSYCKDIAIDISVDELIGFHRQRSDKSFEWILDNLNDDAHVGLKEIHTPVGKMFPWENGPYLEVFMRNDIKGIDYFFFIIVDYKYLPELIKKFNLKKY